MSQDEEAQREMLVIAPESEVVSLNHDYEEKDIVIMNPPEVYRNKIVKVKQANEVSRSIWPIKTIWGGRILAYLASMIKDDDPENKTYIIPLNELALESGRQRDGAFLKELDDTTTMILQTVILLRDKEDEGDIEKFSPLCYCRIKMKEGIIEAQFTPQMKPFYSNLKDNYTLYPRQEFLRLRSLYSQRLYELLMSWRNVQSGKVELPLEDLHRKLLVSESQRKNFGEFNRRVLQPALKEIKEITSLSVMAIPQKENANSKTSRVRSVVFVFDEKKVQEQELLLHDKLKKDSHDCYQKLKLSLQPCKPKPCPRCEFCMTRGIMFSILSAEAEECARSFCEKDKDCKPDKRTSLCKFCLKNRINEKIKKGHYQQEINFDSK
ncbi:MAG: replication initiation protein [Pyramidobacter sp.]|nr:replication initiation protein [Pyramidobacter sp.]